MSTRAKTAKVSYNWHLRMRMAERGMFATSRPGAAAGRTRRGAVPRAGLPAGGQGPRTGQPHRAGGAVRRPRGQPGRTRGAGPGREQDGTGQGRVGPGGGGRICSAGPGGPHGVTPACQQAWRDLVCRRVAEASAGLSVVQVSSALRRGGTERQGAVGAGQSARAGPGCPGHRRWSASWSANFEREARLCPSPPVPAAGGRTPSSPLLRWAGSAPCAGGVTWPWPFACCGVVKPVAVVGRSVSPGARSAPLGPSGAARSVDEYGRSPGVPMTVKVNCATAVSTAH